MLSTLRWSSRNSQCTLCSYKKPSVAQLFSSFSQFEMVLWCWLCYISSTECKYWKRIDGFCKMSKSHVLFFLENSNLFILFSICHSNLASTCTETAVGWIWCNSLLINAPTQIWTLTCSAASIGSKTNMLIYLQEEIYFYIQQLLQLF